LNDIPRTALLIALLSMLGACNKAVPAPDPARDIASARRHAEAVHRTLAALSPACIVGTARDAQGSWQAAPKAFPEPGQPYTFVQQFDAAISTGAVRAGLNRAALRALAKVETRDAQGRWMDAGPVTVHEAPRGCDYVWLQQDLGGQRQVEALRYTFRRSEEMVSVSDAAILKSNR
jgi:predicted pyridoxine 5'-phosphate oxidase superfamily flavin-nucleotide-binding protein